MKKVTKKDWLKYKNKLAEISQKAADELKYWIDEMGGIGVADREELIRYAYALVKKYGEASGAYTAQYYDDTALLSKKNLPPAEVAELPSYGEVAKAINGTIKRSIKSDYVGSTAGRLVKQVSADTLQKNALRDGAEWAWVPAGDTCVFCLTLASRGWQKASKKALKNGHAEHIHANCDCTYAVRFDPNTDVAGYEPKKYRKIYENAEGDTPDEKINSMRRMQYQEKKDKTQASEYYTNKQTGGKITGGHRYPTDEKSTEKDKKAAKKYEEFSRNDDSKTIAKNTGFSAKEIKAIRSHIFFNKHDLDNGYGRFAPDYDMAVAWQRLIDGKYFSRDITLLNHELLESQLEKEYNLSAREAHELAQKTYNWLKQLMDETNGKGEADGLL